MMLHITNHHKSQWDITLYLIINRIATIFRKGESNKSRRILLHCWWKCKMVQSLWKTVWQFLQKLKIELPYNPETSFWIYTQRIESMNLKRYLYTYIHTIHNSQKMEATQVSTDRWMEKQTVEYHTNNGILFSPKKEENPDTCFSTQEPWGHYAYWNEQSQIPYDST